MLSDFRYALRQLLKSPGFTAVAILTLALCIGANSAIFSVVHAILLKPYPWPDSQRLVYCYNSYPLMGLQNAGVSVPDYLDRRAGVSGFADTAMFSNQSFNLAGSSSPERVIGLRATPSLFSTLETGAALGRVFNDDEALPGREKVVVLAHSLWRNRFGGDATIVGKTIRLNGEPFTVIGVMPEDFYFPTPSVQAWVPFAFTSADRADRERGHEYSSMIARLKPGATLASVQRELDTIQLQNAQRLPGQAPFWKSSGFGGRAAGFLEQNVDDIRGMLWLVQAGVAAALLIGCANVASLLLARAVARERELAIRAALGAGRGRLIRLLLTESLVLFLAGGALGLLVALWGVGALGSFGVSSLPRAFSVELDLTVFGFTLLCALLAGVIFGALPAWSASRGDAAALKEAGARATASRRTQRLRALLVVTEIALAVMLLSTASLLVKSFTRLQEQNPGFVPEHVLTARMNLAGPAYADDVNRRGLFERLLERVRALPGVTSAAITSSLPFGSSFSQSSYRIDGYTVPAGQPQPHGFRRSVSPDYFRALGIPLLRGRTFTPQDNAAAPGVVIIDRVLAERYWPNGGDPIGRKIFGGDGPGDKPWTIVGVVATTKNASLGDQVTKETLYFPLDQAPDMFASLIVKSTAAPSTLIAPVRAAMTAVDPEQPLFDLKTLDARIDDSLAVRRTPMMLLSLFSGVALLLAALGIYGVLAFSVAQRTAEFGIRLALGATARDIAVLVLRQGTLLVVIGVATGLAGYLALSRLIAKLLYGVSSADPATLALAPLVLALVAFTASLLPARRATKVDPMIALRAE